MIIYESTITKLQKLPESLIQEVNQFIESLTKRQIKTESSDRIRIWPQEAMARLHRSPSELS